MSLQEDFKHSQHAHCESGVTANMLRHHGINISEPMAFGIGAGIFFGHMPFLKVQGTPGTTYRIWPGYIFKRVTNRLGIDIKTQKFSRPAAAMQALDKALDMGKPVGMLTSVYYLPYMPEAFRFHFNAHNLMVYGKENGQYLVSDPGLDHTTTIDPDDLTRARFAKGFPEPGGYMYYIDSISPKLDYEKAIASGIKQTCFFMLSPPLPWFGQKAIPLLANQIRNYPRKLTPRKSALFLGNLIRMQEEMGTGGGGFRYLYAAFLQEAGELMKRDDLLEASSRLTIIGDNWRNFAYEAARQVKDRSGNVASYVMLGDMLQAIGEQEKKFFKDLKGLKF